MKRIKQKKNTKTSEELLAEMDTMQLSRWLALFHGVNVIADGAEDNNEIFDNINIKKTALTEYVDNTSELIYRELNGRNNE